MLTLHSRYFLSAFSMVSGWSRSEVTLVLSVLWWLLGRVRSRGINCRNEVLMFLKGLGRVLEFCEVGLHLLALWLRLHPCLSRGSFLLKSHLQMWILITSYCDCVVLTKSKNATSVGIPFQQGYDHGFIDAL